MLKCFPLSPGTYELDMHSKIQLVDVENLDGISPRSLHSLLTLLGPEASSD